MMIARRLGVLALLVAAPPAHAQVRPVPGSGDPRLQTVLYAPDQVVELSIATGYQLMVSFAPGERIETIAVGDSAAWQVTANKSGAYLFVKAVQAGGDSNLTVVTDAHVYSFALIRAFGPDSEMPFAVNFTYPPPPPAVVAKQVDTASYRYRLSGARAIRPSLVQAEGTNLVLEWPISSALPAVFRIDDDGQETLVNGEMRDGRFVVAGSPTRLIFRLDRSIATATRVPTRGSRP